MPYRTLAVTEADGIHTIVLNRPERRNALNAEITGELTRALEEATHCDCGVILLTGAGTAFCSGMDLEHLKTLDERRPEEKRHDAHSVMRLMRSLYDFPKPTIAAVNGPAIAGGTGLATLCDYTLAVPGAKFGYTEVKIGLLPAVVSVFLLRMVGEKRARELLLSGRLFTAEEALELGLVTEIVAETSLMDRARQLAATLLRNSPASMTAVKAMLSGFARTRLDEDLTSALQWSEKVREGADFREGLRAFLEKREPVWSARPHK